MKKSTLQVRLNGRVTFDRRIEVPSPSFFLTKNEEKKSFADWLIELANRGFGMSTDAFLNSVKKFLDKEVSIVCYLTTARVPHHTPVICYVLFHDARLCFWNRLPDYFASAREAYKSLACRNLFTITLLVLCADTGPAVRIQGNIGALQKYQFRDGKKWQNS